MMRSSYDDDDVVRDGERVRVPLTMMDQQQIADLKQRYGKTSKLYDGFGNPAGHRPGFVFGDTTPADELRVADAYEAYCERTSNAWKQPTQEPAQPQHRDAASDPREAYMRRLSEAWRTGQ
jgi:hypothetical protein